MSNKAQKPRVKEPQQERSREKLRRILSAAKKAIGEKGFEGASVTYIVKSAGLSVGCFYQRFDNKEHLLQVLHEESVKINIYEMRKILDAKNWESETARTILEKAISGIIEIAERNADFNRACYQRALQDERFALGLTKERLEFSDLLGALLMEHLDHDSPKRLRKKIDFCLTVIIATVSDLEVAPNFSILRTPLSNKQLTENLLDLCCRYLDIP